MKDTAKGLSLTIRGARVYFAVGIALISLIPLLSLIYLRINDAGIDGFSMHECCILFFGVGLSVIIGYAVQGRYPRTIMKLRAYLERIVQGELPDKIALIRGEDDISAIEDCMNLVLTQLRRELKTMEVQKTRLEEELFQARRLEAIGTLAAGISHEISTPLQFVSNNVQFLGKACSDVFEMMDSYRKVPAESEKDGRVSSIARKNQKETVEARLAFLEKEAAKAVEQCRDGVERIAGTVKAMRDFAHGREDGERTTADINKVAESAIALSRNEWKYAAEMETDLDPSLPPVSCYPAEIKQVVINLVVNAAQAIEAVSEAQRKDSGRIIIITRGEDDSVTISVSDTGVGIPENLRDKVFEPFFSTRETPSGMGLSFAYSSVVTRHGGQLTFRTTEGGGTTFMVTLPLGKNGTEDVKHET